MTSETKSGLQVVVAVWICIAVVFGLIWLLGPVAVLLFVALGLSISAFYIGAGII